MSKLELEMREEFENNKVVYDGYVKLNFIVAWRKEHGQVSCFRLVDIFVSWGNNSGFSMRHGVWQAESANTRSYLTLI